MMNELVCRKIKQARKEKRMHQSELASAIGYSQQLISSIEKCNTIPDYDTLFKISQVTNKPLSWFFEIHNPAQVSETKDIQGTIPKSNDSLAEKLDNKASGDTNIERGMVQKPNMEKVELLLANLVAKQDQLLEELKKDRQKQMELLAGIFLKGESTGRLAERVKQLAQQVMYNTEHSGHIEEIGSQVKE